MSDEKLIADQARKIAKLEKMVSDYTESHKAIYNIIYCVGGPLNDNKLEYTGAQLDTFFRINNQLIDDDFY